MEILIDTETMHEQFPKLSRIKFKNEFSEVKMKPFNLEKF